MTVPTLCFGKQYLFAGKSEDAIGENISFTKISYFRHVYFSRFLLGGWLDPVVNK